MACSDQGGVNRYIYKITSASGISLSNDTSELYVTVGGLLPCMNYTFRVRAGDGNFSQPIEASTDYVGKFLP